MVNTAMALNMKAMTHRPLSVVVLAAGAGTRMKSKLPKPLHELCERPMVSHVLQALHGLPIDWVTLVVGHGAQQVVDAMRDTVVNDHRLHFVEQHVQRGTGDAVSIALASLPSRLCEDAEDADLIVVPGDMPLLANESMNALLAMHRETDAAATVMTVSPEDPSGYGRVVRDKNNRVIRIVEDRDASDEVRVINEVNTSVYCFRTGLLRAALRRIDDNNAQGELLLPDVISVLASAGHRVEALVVPGASWAVGVNDRAQLALAELQLRQRMNAHWMNAGVTIRSLDSVYIGPNVMLAPDVELRDNTRLMGSTSIGAGSKVGPHVDLTNCVIGDNATVSHSVGTDALVGRNAVVGPFAVLAAHANVGDGVETGSFVTLHGIPSSEGAS